MKDTDLYQHVLGLREPWSVSKVEMDQYCPNVSFPSSCNMLRGFQFPNEDQFIDLKSAPAGGDTPAPTRELMAYERSQDNLLSTDGLPAHVRVSQVCPSLQRQLQGQEVLLLESVSLYGLCPTHLRGLE
jgi:hypothetical protein